VQENRITRKVNTAGFRQIDAAVDTRVSMTEVVLTHDRWEHAIEMELDALVWELKREYRRIFTEQRRALLEPRLRSER